MPQRIKGSPQNFPLLTFPEIQENNTLTPKNITQDSGENQTSGEKDEQKEKMIPRSDPLTFHPHDLIDMYIKITTKNRNGK